MKRLPDWPERLIEFIEARRVRAFSYGENDCGLFAADAIYAITGVDLAESWRGYASAQGAARKVKKSGGMRGIAAAAGLDERHAGFAQRGDLVLADVEGRETFGIVVGDGNWCGPGADGLVFRPMSDVIAVFGV